MTTEAAPATPAPELDDDLLDALDRAFRRLRRSMVRSPLVSVPVPSLGRPLELAKIMACDALHQLRATADVVTVKDLAGALHLEHSTVSRLLGEIEAEGLLTRGVDPQDRRRTTLALTGAGEAVVADARRMRRFMSRSVLSDWTQDDVSRLTELLTRLADTATVRLASLPELARAEFCGGAGPTLD